MRSCTHALALNDISLIFFWRVRRPRKHEIKKASFLGGRGDRFNKKSFQWKCHQRSSPHSRDSRLLHKVEKKNIWNSKVWNFKFKVFEGNGDYDEARDSVEEGCTYTCTQPPYNVTYTHTIIYRVNYHHKYCRRINLQCKLQSLLASLIHLIT